MLIISPAPCHVKRESGFFLFSCRIHAHFQKHRIPLDRIGYGAFYKFACNFPGLRYMRIYLFYIPLLYQWRKIAHRAF